MVVVEVVEWGVSSFMQLLPPWSESPMPTSQFFPSSSKLSKEEGGKRKRKKENEPKPAFMKPYINADEEFKVLKRVRGGWAGGEKSTRCTAIRCSGFVL